MADKRKGFIYLYRCILDSAIWESDEPYSRRDAWIDLLLMVNHADREIIVDGQPLTVHRGQKFTSIRKLAARWQWSVERVMRYIDLLVSMGMLYKSATYRGTLLTIINYGIYQDVPNADKNADKNAGTNNPTNAGTNADTTQTSNGSNGSNDLSNGSNIGHRHFSAAYKDVKWQ